MFIQVDHPLSRSPLPVNMESVWVFGQLRQGIELAEGGPMAITLLRFS